MHAARAKSNADSRPVWWLVCDAHDATPLGGIASAWNDPWPERQKAHNHLAARVLGDRFTPGEIPTPGGGLYALAVSTVQKRRGWKTADHVVVDRDGARMTCPTCGRSVSVPTADLLPRLESFTPGTTVPMRSLVGHLSITR